MKKFLKALAALMASTMLFGAMFTSCSSDDDDDGGNETPKITITADSTSVKVDSTLKLTSDVEDVSWKVDKAEYATLSATEDGEFAETATGTTVYLKGVADGRVVVTASKEGCTDGTIDLTVGEGSSDDPDTPADGAMGFVWLAEEHMDGLEYVTDDEKKTTTKTYQDDITEEKAFGDVTVLATSTSTITRTYNGETELTIGGETKSVKGYFQLKVGGTAAKKAMKFTVPSDAISVAIYAKGSSKSKTCKLVLSDGTTEVISQEAPTAYTAVTYTPSLTADTVFYLYNDADSSTGGGTNVKAIVVTTPPYTLQSIKVTTPPTKLEYAKNDTELSTDGMVVKATYSNGTKEVSKEVTGWTTSEFTAGTEGTQTITVSYTEGEGDSAVTQTDTFEINVKGVTQTGIEVTTKPTTTTYEQESAIDLTGLEIAPVMSDGSKGTAVAYSSTSGITVEGFDSSTAGENITKTITVKYGEYTATFEYTYTVTAVTYFTKFDAKELYGDATSNATISAEKTASDGSWTLAADSKNKAVVKKGPFATYDYDATAGIGYSWENRLSFEKKNASLKLKVGAGKSVVLRVDGGGSDSATSYTEGKTPAVFTFKGAGDAVTWSPVVSLSTFYASVTGDSDGYVVITAATAAGANIYGITVVDSAVDLTGKTRTEDKVTYNAPAITLAETAEIAENAKTVDLTATVATPTSSTVTYTAAVDGTSVSIGDAVSTDLSDAAVSLQWSTVSGETVKAIDGATSETYTANDSGTYRLTASYTAADNKPYTSTADCVVSNANNEKFTVSFNANGGSEVESQTVESGKIATEPTSTKEGYTLEGWYTEEALTNKYDFSTAVTANITLYAKWAAATSVTYTLTVSSSTEAKAATETPMGTDNFFTVNCRNAVPSSQNDSTNTALSVINMKGEVKYTSKNKQDYIMFTTTGPASVTVKYFNGNPDRYCKIISSSDGNAVSDADTSSAPTTKDKAIKTGTMTLSSAGTYCLGGSGGIYITEVSVTVQK